jgi:hypothetical protein
MIRRLIKDELGMMWKGVVVACSKLFLYLLGGAGTDYREPHSG